jgi:phosphatidate cytidylyltransferase
MLKTRLWMGTFLIALVICVLLFDPSPCYPFLLLLVIFLAVGGSVELYQLIGAAHGLPLWLSSGSVLLMLLANWPAHLWPGFFGNDSWRLVCAALTTVVLVSFLVEMTVFSSPSHAAEPPPTLGRVTIRLSLLVWITVYLGLLPSFLIQLRWFSVAALALGIFIPKCGDMGAYFTGRLLGRRSLAPVLSPKKTWEGLLGGLLLSAAAAVAINRPLSVVRGGDWMAAAFGLVVGGAGALGDLAESMIKRDCRCKDASQMMPGFGGVLDVIDSILFAAPIAYGWLLC